MSVRTHLATLPTDLADALDETYRNILDHFLRDEWDDAQVDAGRFSEAVLRYLEWKVSGMYTPIDGKQKPNRSSVIGTAKNATGLPPTLRAQVPLAVELMMDFRNNRNAAHLGSIQPNRMDAACVMENASWVMGEIARLESRASTAEVQRLLDQLAVRHVPLIQRVGDTPVVLDPKLTAAERALVLLYQHGAPVQLTTLRKWAEYSHATQWRNTVIGGLRRAKLVYVDAEDLVHLLRPGEVRAQAILVAGGAVAA